MFSISQLKLGVFILITKGISKLFLSACEGGSQKNKKVQLEIKYELEITNEAVSFLRL